MTYYRLKVKKVRSCFKDAVIESLSWFWSQKVVLAPTEQKYSIVKLRLKEPSCWFVTCDTF